MVLPSAVRPVARTSRRPPDPDARDRLAALAPRLTTGPLTGERTLAVHPALHGVLPQGLPLGATVLSRGQAAVSAAFLLAAAGSQAGAWTGVAGLPAFGVQAGTEAGIVLDRRVAVRAPDGAGAHDFGDDTWGQVLGALIDGFDIVVFGAAARVRPGTARRVQTRLAHRGAVLLLVGAPGPFSADIEVVTRSSWEGLGQGHGHLRARRMEIAVDGRRIRRPRRDALWFPGFEGQIGRIDVRMGEGVGKGDATVPVTTVPVVPMRRTG